MVEIKEEIVVGNFDSVIYRINKNNFAIIDYFNA